MMMRRRLRILAGILAAAYLLILGRLFSMQVVSGQEYEVEAFRRLQRTIYLAPRRGTIYDRSHRPLAINEPGFDLMVIPSEVTDRSAARVAQLLALPPDEMIERYRDVEAGIAQEVAREVRRYERDMGRPVSGVYERRMDRLYRRQDWLLVPDLDDEATRLEIYVFPDRYPGFTIRARAIRRYPEKDVACHILGHMSRIYAEEYEDLRVEGYFMNDLVGRGGIESICEERLRGQRGMKIVERDFKNNVREVLFKEAAVAGADVALAIDLELQRRAEAILDDALDKARTRVALRGLPVPRGAAAVLMDIATGDVYCLASSPRFDVNRVAKDYGRLVADENGPLHDRTVAPPRVAPPGSVYKILSAIAGIENGTLEPARTHYCRGYLKRPGSFRCHLRTGHGALDLYHSIEQSCDIYFYIEGEEMGPDVMAGWSRAFGLGVRSGISVRRESAGLIPSVAWKLEQVGEEWYPGNSRHMAIGQGYVEATPLQIARFMAAVATGRLVRPRLDLGRPVESQPVGASPRTLAIVREGMRLVVEGHRGTARRIEEFRTYQASAKTGTSEAGRGQEDHAWIAGFAPRDRPRFAFAVLVENSGHGGEVAGPVAGQLLEAAFELLGPDGDRR